MVFESIFIVRSAQPCGFRSLVSEKDDPTLPFVSLPSIQSCLLCLSRVLFLSLRHLSLSPPQATLGVGHKMEAGVLKVGFGFGNGLAAAGRSLKWMLSFFFLGWIIASGATRVQGYYINNPQVKNKIKNCAYETFCQIRD